MKIFAIASVMVFLGTAVSLFAAEREADYDRLDGHGASGMKVNVIEWEKNLEVHVYPAGSLKGLALKLDKKNKDKPVMVIGFRFNNAPEKQLIRRAILGIEMHEGFKAFVDPSTVSDGYDKIIISNNGLASLAEYKLEAEPKQLYPDGHPALASADAKSEPKDGVKEPVTASGTRVGEKSEKVRAAERKLAAAKAAAKAEEEASQPGDNDSQSGSQKEEEGRIKAFSW